jgi:hypothetical protein
MNQDIIIPFRHSFFVFLSDEVLTSKISLKDLYYKKDGA